MAEGAVTLANPLSAELGVMRTWLLPGLVDALGRNVARQQSRVRLFEVGKVFGSREPGAGSREAGAPVETLRVAGAVRSEEHTSELQSLMRISYAVFCLKKKKSNSIKSCLEHNHRSL